MLPFYSWQHLENLLSLNITFLPCCVDKNKMLRYKSTKVAPGKGNMC